MLKKSVITTYILLVVSANILAAVGQARSSLLAEYHQFRNLEFSNNAFEVSDLRLLRANAEVLLKSGRLFFLESHRDKVTGCVFIGEGTLRFSTSNRIESEQIAKYLEADSIDKDFGSAYIRFTDSTFDEVSSHAKSAIIEVPGNAREMRARFNELFLEERNINLESSVFGGLINPLQRPFFFAVFDIRKPNSPFPEYLVYNYDQNSGEPVAVYAFWPHRIGKPFYTLCSFAIDDPSAADTTEHDSIVYGLARVTNYKMEIVVEKNGEMKVKAKALLHSNVDSLRVLSFLLLHELEVDSVKEVSSGGMPDSLSFIQEKKESGVSVLFDKPLSASQEFEVVFHYSGEAFETATGKYELKNPIFWYPRYGYFEPATYDLTFDIPEKMAVVSTGTKKRQWQEKKRQYSNWVEDNPTAVSGFNIGYLDSTHISNDLLPISVLSTREFSQKDRQRAGGDVASAYYFLNSLFGSYPYADLSVVETPGHTSSGFPGLLLLSSASFDQEIPGAAESLRGHEVSHQWWGNIVGWKTYHDQWLSEGLAEYSGAMFTQFLLPDDRAFLEIVAAWHSDLLHGGSVAVSLGLQKFGFPKTSLTQSRGMEAGPISLGRRLGQEFPVDYHLVVYLKGACVFHMLRMMLRDNKTNSDHRFLALLADFVSQYRGREATTADFQNLVSEHAGQDMQWFFDQWVHQSEVPTCRYRGKFGQGDDGYWLDLNVKQEDVDSPYRLAIPVTINGPGDTGVTELVWVDAFENDVRLGPVSFSPESFEFNASYGVLARVKED